MLLVVWVLMWAQPTCTGIPSLVSGSNEKVSRHDGEVLYETHVPGVEPKAQTVGFL